MRIIIRMPQVASCRHCLSHRVRLVLRAESRSRDITSASESGSVDPAAVIPCTMSAWNLGADDTSPQTQALKDKLSSKGATHSCPIPPVAYNSTVDSECAALQSQLFKRNTEFNELKATLNETLHKACTFPPLCSGFPNRTHS